MRLILGPLVYSLSDAGPADRVFDVMLLGGPLVIVLLATVGRTPVTVAIVAMYLVAFLGYVLYKGST